MSEGPMETYMGYGFGIVFFAFVGGIVLPDAGTFFLCNGIAWVIAIYLWYTGSIKQKEYDRNKEKTTAEIIRRNAQNQIDENIRRSAQIESENRRRKAQLENNARNKEKYLDYKGALRIWDDLGNLEEGKRLRLKIRDEEKVKVDQTVVQGNYVDDRDTIVKDSVLNRSKVGDSGKSKSEELREAKALLDDGIIDDAEFKQMKKEILGK